MEAERGRNMKKRNKKQDQYENSSLLRETLTRMVKSPTSKVACAALCVIVICCVAAPLLTPYKPTDMDVTHMFSGPSAAHPLGTDSYGRDMLSRLLYGGRYSIALGLAAAVFGSVFGIIFGCIAGYFGGKVETVIMDRRTILLKSRRILTENISRTCSLMIRWWNYSE